MDRDFVSLHFGLILSRELSFRGLPLSHDPTVLGVPSQRSDGHHKMVDFGPISTSALGLRGYSHRSTRLRHWLGAGRFRPSIASKRLSSRNVDPDLFWPSVSVTGW